MNLIPRVRAARIQSGSRSRRRGSPLTSIAHLDSAMASSTWFIRHSSGGRDPINLPSGWPQILKNIRFGAFQKLYLNALLHPRDLVPLRTQAINPYAAGIVGAG